MSDAVTIEAEAEPSTALAIIPRASLPTILAADDQDILGKLAAKIRAHKPDISTPKGQAAIRSLAREVQVAKADLERLANSLTEGWRKSTAAVIAERKIIEAKMDELRTEVRRPLTELEDEQKRRALVNEGRLRDIQVLWQFLSPDASSETVNEALQALAEIDQDGHDWELFKDRADEAITDATRMLVDALERAQKREAEAAELEQLRAAQRETQRKEGHRAAINAILDFLVTPDDRVLGSGECRARLERLDNLPARDWEEFLDQAVYELESVRRSITRWLNDALADEAEAQRLREEQIKAEAAEQARLAAEAEAERKAKETAAETQRLLDEAAEREQRNLQDLAAAAERDRQTEATRKAGLERNLAVLRGFATDWPTEPTLPLMEARLARAQAAGEVDWQEYSDEAKAALDETIQSLNEQIAEAREDLRLAEEGRQQEIKDAAIEAERQRATKAQQRADYHRSMLQHVKNCGMGFIGPDPQPIGLLQYELTEKIKYNEENFGDLLAEALTARDAALALIQKSIDERNRRHAEEAEREAQRAADEKRAANVAHRGKINRAARDAIEKVLHSVAATTAMNGQEAAEAVITAIAKGSVPRVAIDYASADTKGLLV